MLEIVFERVGVLLKVLEIVEEIVFEAVGVLDSVFECVGVLLRVLDGDDPSPAAFNAI